MPKSLTPKEFLERMKEIEIYQNDDTETAHSEADKLMCSLLRSLGYGAGVKVFEKKMEKWYA